MPETYCIGNAELVDVAAGAIRSRRTVVVRDGAVEAVLDAPPAGLDRVRDAAGRYLCPGLIDAHAHFFWDGGSDPRRTYLDSDDEARLECARRNARAAIAAGITTMRDCAAPAPLIYQFQGEVQRGEAPGPHIISCGQALMRPRGHCHFMGGEVESVAEVRARCESQLAQGAGFVKLMASGGGMTPGTVPHLADLPVEQMRAAAEVAHAHGVQVTAHCHATGSLVRALEARLDMVEHANFVEPPGRYRFDEEIAARMRDQGMVVCPTVFCALQTARRFRAAGTVHNPDDLAALERLEGRMANTAHFQRLGMRIVAGTDGGGTDTPFDSLVDELLCFTRAGLGPAEALQSATSGAAAALGLSRTGHIKPEYRADLILLKADPLRDLDALRQPLQVYKSGRLVYERPPSPAPAASGAAGNASNRREP